MQNAIFKLKSQTFGHGPETGDVYAVQHWSGFDRGRHGLVVVTNDRVTTQRAGTPQLIASAYRLHVATLTDDLTEDQARDHLHATTGTRSRACECTAVLPLGGRWCVACGKPQPELNAAHRPVQTASL